MVAVLHVFTFPPPQTKTTDIQLSFSMLSDVLYESEYISQLYMVYNSNREYMGAGDAYPHQVRTCACSSDTHLQYNYIILCLMLVLTVELNSAYFCMLIYCTYTEQIIYENNLLKQVMY